MRTPAGTECPYFYGNYFRGRSQEECRLIGDAAPPRNWKPEYCKNCPVPGITRANSCPTMTLKAEVNPGLLKRGKKIKVTAYCTRSQSVVTEPHVGCGVCHQLPPIITEEK
ncbi:MAG TPA: hypothetical protein VN376_01410 [Longilinea sp.]|nr:hypothetical protein [Longilinea sp.]